MSTNPLIATEAENTVLSAIIVDNAKLPIVESCLGSDDFGLPAHGAIFRAMQAMHEEGEPIDFVTLRERLAGDEAARLAVRQIDGYVPDLANVQHYASIVRKYAHKRYLGNIADTILKSMDSNEDPAIIAARANERLSRFATSEETGTFRIDQVMKEVLAEIEYRHATGDNFPGIRTGYFGLDGAIQGWQRGLTHMIAARTSIGKTALTLNLLLGAHREDEQLHSVLFSLEMPRKLLARRLLATESGIDKNKITTGLLSDAELLEVGRSAGRLGSHENRILLIDQPLKVEQIEATCRNIKKTQPLDIVWVDYIQLVQGGSAETRQLQISHISKKLLALAQELDVAVIFLAQLNLEEGRPSLRHARDAKDIVMDARLVILIDRPGFDDLDIPDCKTIVQVAKGGEVGKGDLEFHFNGPKQIFEEGPCRPGCRHFDQYAPTLSVSGQAVQQAMSTVVPRR